MNLADALTMTPISSLDLSRYVTVSTSATVAETVEAMRRGERSCACVVDGDTLTGVFTQRDVLHRAIGRPGNWSTPIVDQMSGPLKTIGNGQSVADAIELMNRWWIRNLPVVETDGGFVGNVSYWTIMATITNLLASRIDNSHRTAAVRDGLDFVDFTGLNLYPPVAIEQHEPLEVAVHHLRNRGISQILVVDGRDRPRVHGHRAHRIVVRRRGGPGRGDPRPRQHPRRWDRQLDRRQRRDRGRVG